MASLLFEDIFTIRAINPDGMKFDKVSRIEAHSERFDMHLLLDVNTEIYPLLEDAKFKLVLASTLSSDGIIDDGTFDQTGTKSLADNYEYVMYGKLYKYSDSDSANKIEIYVSFGGLIMKLKGDPNNLNNFQMDQRMYLLMRHVK